MKKFRFQITNGKLKSISDYIRDGWLDYMKEHNGQMVHIVPIVEDSQNARSYLEGAVIPEYCEYQYNIPKRELGKAETRRFLFKRDFCFEMHKDRNGEPVKAPKSSKGVVKEILDVWTRWADTNGCPVPNPELYKLWKSKWIHKYEWYEFLDKLGIDCDGFPTNETLAKLEEDNGKLEYPEMEEEVKF